MRLLQARPCDLSLCTSHRTFTLCCAFEGAITPPPPSLHVNHACSAALHAGAAIPILPRL